MMRRALIGVATAITLASGGACASSSNSGAVKSITVAAASDAKPAFDLIAADFTKRTGIAVVFSYGSSGKLADQIINGAAFDLFASADRSQVDKVVKAGNGDVSTVTNYAQGQIVMWVPSGSAPTSVAELAAKKYTRIAIANPDHAPYGKAAKAALTTAKIFDAVQSRLVLGDNAADTLRLATSGNVDVAIVPLSLAIAAKSGSYVGIPIADYPAVVQSLVVTTQSRSTPGATKQLEAAKKFAQAIVSVAGQKVLAAAGFLPPPTR